MILNETQTNKLRQILKCSNIESRLVRKDLLDHLCCMVENEMEKGYSFEDAFERVSAMFSKQELKMTEINTLKILNMEKKFSKNVSMVATIPFGLFGLYWMFSNSGLNVPGVIQSILLLSAIISMFVTLSIGWINSFPAWSFQAIGFSLLFSGYFMNVSIPSISGDILGLWAWLPLLLTLIVSLIIKPGIAPLINLFKNVKEEPSLILFALYGFSPFIVLILSDEIHANWMIPISIFVTAVLSAGIYLFLTCNKRVFRVLSLIVAGVISITVTMFAANIYWE